MPNQKLGVTANELFACNPFRILGLPVNAEENVIEETYQKLLSMAASGTAGSYKTDFDFPSLPPFTRDEATLKTAYAKLASSGYRAFAYSDGVFSQSLNIDDVMLNLQDITCYDCFLRCYMWLITNDRAFEEPELWVPLCKYIDEMIAAPADKWGRYFDDRFSRSVLRQAGEAALDDFHNTFKDIILLPIKEMVRGSMRCTSAIQILAMAKVDVNEVFEEIEIPQANKPKEGWPAPKLKIAVKEGEEYFDVAQGKMVSFDSKTDSAVETHDFAAATSAISAAAILSEEEPEPEPVPQQRVVQTAPPPVQPAAAQPQEEHKVSLVDDMIASQAAQQQSSGPRTSLTEEPEVPVQHVEAIDTLSRRPRPRPAQPVQAQTEERPLDAGGPLDLGLPEEGSGVTITNADPDVDLKKRDTNMGPVKYYVDEPTANVGERTLEAIDPFAMDGGSSPRPSAAPAAPAGTTKTVAGTPHKRTVTLTGMDGLDSEGQSNAELDAMFKRPEGYQAPQETYSEEEEKTSNVTERRTLSSILEDIETKTDETTDVLLTEQEEEDALYTDTLVKLLRSSANSNKRMMKGVDTTHVFNNGDAQMNPSQRSSVTMDDIDLRKMDQSRLDAAYDGARTADESRAKEALKAKYRSKASNINDMLNPTLGQRSTRGFAPDAIQEYKKEKAAEKKFSASFAKFIAFAVFVAVVIGVLVFITSS